MIMQAGHLKVLLSPSAIHLSKSKSPLLKDALCQVWLKVASKWFWRKEFLTFANVLSLLNPRWRGCGLSFENKLESPLPMDVLCKIWLNGSMDRKRLLNANSILTILHLSLHKKGLSLHMNKLESASSKDALCQVWLKLVKWFWRTWILFTKGYFVPSLVENGLRKKIICHQCIFTI